MLVFHLTNKDTVQFNQGSDAKSMTHEQSLAIVGLTADGPEKKMLARAGIQFPRFHGPVNLPTAESRMVALNLAPIVEKYGKKQEPLIVHDPDGEPEDEDSDD